MSGEKAISKPRVPPDVWVVPLCVVALYAVVAPLAWRAAWKALRSELPAEGLLVGLAALGLVAFPGLLARARWA